MQEPVVQDARGFREMKTSQRRGAVSLVRREPERVFFLYFRYPAWYTAFRKSYMYDFAHLQRKRLLWLTIRH